MLGESLNMILIIKMVISNSWGLSLSNRIVLPALLVYPFSVHKKIIYSFNIRVLLDCIFQFSS